MSQPRKTKIVATIGPASADPQVLGKVIAAGLDVARLNFSHGDHASHQKTMELVRRLAKEQGRTVAILQDLAGPKIRLGDLPEPMWLEAGQEVDLTPGATAAPGVLPVDYAGLVEDVAPGQSILLADGMVELKVARVAGGRVTAMVKVGGEVSSRKGVNLPTSELGVSSFTAKDQRDLEMGLAAGVDLVALSFVRSERDLAPVRERLNHCENPPLLVAKIEKPQAVDRLHEILAAVDGVMVARGDLGVEMPLEQVPLIQKRIIAEGRRAGKVVVTATQMLRSMMDNPRPTRAEAADVANAILDGTDAVMLSDETAMGSYPVESVAMMDRLCRAVEGNVNSETLLKEELSPLLPAVAAALSRAACWLSRDLKPAAIVASTTSGSTARLISRYRPEATFVGLTPDPSTCRQLALSWGVVPALVEPFEDIEEMAQRAARWILDNGLAQPGEHIILTGGVPVGTPGTTNLLKVLEL
ncbi:MAG: pyruvate kinase [Proteobacteria bacterium]|nr:pyruvate kinase [Pseudomonadota bacterium]MBU4382366.1 pyruvate kinase [Pseudomonadota bacterium]MBU4606513.1 pyruvate kinase [Pseudomonadota bacterium]MCG2766030.1 pyruvate kinase [Desulfarculaceae bacterium]